jgi:hypothetical protein
MSTHRTCAWIASRTLLLVVILLGEQEAVALQTKTVPDPTPRTIAAVEEEVFPCCRLDVSAYPGIGTFGFESRMARSFAVGLGNDVAWWGKHYPEAIGSLISADLGSAANLLRASQPPEDVSIPQVEDAESANRWEPMWGTAASCCQPSIPLSPQVLTAPLIESPSRAGATEVHRASSLKRERRMMKVAEPWTVNSLPEPLYMLLLGSGLLGLGLLRNRSKRA